MSSNPLLQVYHDTLSDYVLGSGEAGLSDAYELGRAVLNLDCSLLRILSTHHDALNELLEPVSDSAEMHRRVNAAATFLIEVLSPFAMACDGYRALLKSVTQPAKRSSKRAH